MDLSKTCRQVTHDEMDNLIVNGLPLDDLIRALDAAALYHRERASMDHSQDHKAKAEEITNCIYDLQLMRHQIGLRPTGGSHEDY